MAVFFKGILAQINLGSSGLNKELLFMPLQSLPVINNVQIGSPVGV